MGESSLMRDGWAVLQPTLTAQPSRSTQRTGPAVLLFLPAPSALLIFGTGFGGDVACDYFWMSSYVGLGS